MTIEENQKALRRWGTRIAFGLGVLMMLAALLVMVLRQQWEQHATEVAEWYEQNIGPLDTESYLRDPVTDDQNLAIAVDKVCAEELFDQDTAVSAGETGQALLGMPKHAQVRPEAKGLLQVDAAELETLRGTVEGHAIALSWMDDLERFTDTRRGRPEPEEPLEDGIRALRAARFRTAQVALLLHDGDCAAAASASVAIERVAASFVGEAHLLYSMLGSATEKLFLATVMHLAEKELAGGCQTPARWG